MNTPTKIALLVFVIAMVMLNAEAQSFKSKHRFSNDGYDDEQTIKIRLGYGRNTNSCDTLFIGKEVHYVLACGDWHGWTKDEKRPKNASNSDGFCLAQETNPKNGRQSFKPINKDWYWLIYLDDMCGHKLLRLTHQNFKTNQYTAYIK